MDLGILPEAMTEAVEAARWYQQRREDLGEAFLTELDAALKNIQAHPQRYPIFQTKRRLGTVRRCLMDRFPYLGGFQINGDLVRVAAVSHAARRQRYWHNRLDH